MRFGAMNFPVVPILEEIEIFGRLGMDFLELAMDPPQAHANKVRQHKKEIVGALSRMNMGLACHLPTFVYTAHLSDAIRKACVDEVIVSLETAADLGAEKIVVHPGYIDGLAVHVQDYALSLAMESLGTIYDRSKALGIVLCVENMFPRVGPYVDPDDFDPIFQAFPDLKLVLDTGHANIGDPFGQRVMSFISRFADRLEHLHLSDNSGHMDEHLSIGRGCIDFESLASALGQVNYDKTITLEIFEQDRTALVNSRMVFEKML